jgi:hypothetical protein
MEPVTLSLTLMTAVAGRVVDWLLDGKAEKLMTSAVGGIIGNRADTLVCSAAQSSWTFFRNLRTQDPALNHDLERATRESYLLATLELIRQAELRTELGPSMLLGAGEADALAAIRRGIEADLRNIDNTLPRPLTDAHLFLIDPETAPSARLANLRQTLRTNLSEDLARWLPGVAVPRVVEELLRDGWVISTAHVQSVRRDWHGLIAIAFVEKLKTLPRLAAVFESRLLAQIASREPAAAPIATFEGLTTTFETITVPLQRIEDTLGVIGRDVTEIKHGVGEIRRGVDDIRKEVGDIKDVASVLGRVPRVMWVSSVLILIAAASVFATDAGTRAVCQVPGVRAACARMAIGGVATPAEEAMWKARTAGDCGTLRAYLARYPDGAYADEASRRLEARITGTRDAWMPQQKTLPLTVRTSIDPLASEGEARADAIARAEREGQAVCAPYAQDEFRLRSTRIVAEAWRCVRRSGGFVCGFDGQVVCAVEARQVNSVERCE